MTIADWNVDQIADLTGKTILVTGANSGIGLEATRIFASKGAEVVMACRNAAKAEAAMAEVRAQTPDARLVFMQLDLASLDSIKAFAETFKQRYTKLDILLNNAGLMAPPLQRTADGFEMQFGTNHLGHFALTGLLLDVLEAADAPRIVQISSVFHRVGRIRFNNLNAEKWYFRWSFYGQSKLANLIFARDLHRRLQNSESKIQVFAAHPGYSDTHLQDTVVAGAFLNALMSQPADQGCLPGVMAATSPDVIPGEYYGPDGFLELKGKPRQAYARPITRNVAVAEKLWAQSEQLTGVHYLSA